METQSKILVLIWCLISFGSCSEKTSVIWLDDLKIKSFSEGIPAVLPKTNAAGDSMKINGIYFERGVGVQTISVLSFFLDGNARQFTAEVGADDKGNKDVPVKFYVIGDRKILFESNEMRVGDQTQKVNVNLKGIKRLGLLVTDEMEGHNKSYCNWGNAQLVMLENHLPEHTPNTDIKHILTPEPSPSPRINSAKVFGATPGNPFLYPIAATGNRPIQFSAENLPDGLSIDGKTGIISGKVAQRGTYLTTIKAKNEFGAAAKELKIKIGDTIALTPPIGWNGWNSWSRNIDREKVIASADAMVRMGLSNHGWTYINIDDAWQGQRGGKYNAIQPNEKFPDFKKMVDYIHGLGLKVGIYSTFTIDKWASFGGPGHWNDPDMLILGNVTTGQDLHPTRLTPDEQYSHMSLFSLLAAPLLIGCPIEQLDDFTLNLLTNDEVKDLGEFEGSFQTEIRHHGVVMLRIYPAK